MEKPKQTLLIEQADRKLKPFRPLESLSIPASGWIKTIRVALKMTLRQLGVRLKISPQSVREMEEREANGSITLNGLKEAARMLDMKLIYGFIPSEESLEKMIEKRAREIATEIVMRTSVSMKLEDQENSKARLRKAIENQTEEIMHSMPKYLWD